MSFNAAPARHTMDKNSTTKLNVAPQICGTRESARARTKMNSFGQGTFTDNEIFRNRLAGIEVRESGHPKIIRNKIYGHESSGGVYVHHYGRADLEKNDVYHNSLSVLWGKKNVDKYAGGLTGVVFCGRVCACSVFFNKKFLWHTSAIRK